MRPGPWSVAECEVPHPAVLMHRTWPNGEPAARVIQLSMHMLLWTVHDRFGDVRTFGFTEGAANKRRTWLRARAAVAKAAWRRVRGEAASRARTVPPG